MVFPPSTSVLLLPCCKSYLDRLRFWYTVFAPDCSRLFFYLAVRITSASSVSHARASPDSGFCAAGANLFCLRAITLRCSVARTILQLQRFQFAVLGILWTGNISPWKLIPGQSPKWAFTTKKGTQTTTTFVLPLTMCWDSTVAVHPSLLWTPGI